MVSVSAFLAASLVTSFKGSLDMGSPEYPVASGDMCSGTKPLTESATEYWFLSLAKKLSSSRRTENRPCVAMHLL